MSAWLPATLDPTGERAGATHPVLKPSSTLDE
jgi:hypothetical protein